MQRYSRESLFWINNQIYFYLNPAEEKLWPNKISRLNRFNVVSNGDGLVQFIQSLPKNNHKRILVSFSVPGSPMPDKSKGHKKSMTGMYVRMIFYTNMFPNKWCTRSTLIFQNTSHCFFSNKQARESFCIKNHPNNMSKLASRSPEDTRFFPTLKFFGLICRSPLSWKRMRSNSFEKANIKNAMLWASYRLLPLHQSFFD